MSALVTYQILAAENDLERPYDCNSCISPISSALMNSLFECVMQPVSSVLDCLKTCTLSQRVSIPANASPQQIRSMAIYQNCHANFPL